jgi:hypothetical protein
MNTTLNKIAARCPCASGWRKLLRALNKTEPDDEPLSLLTVLDSNGVEDAIWCFRAVDGFDREKRLFAVWCARQVQHLNPDPRLATALDTAERFANGQASEDDLRAAANAAANAAADAANAAADAAYAAAYAAAAYAAANAAAYAADAATYADAAAAARNGQEAKLREVLLSTTHEAAA